MRKFLAILALALVTTTGAKAADGYDYPYLVVTAAGEQAVLAVDGLTIAYSSTTLTATNSDGTQTFALTDLSTMRFATAEDVQTAIDAVAAAAGGEAVNVYTTGGLLVGRFSSVGQAKAALRGGIYIVKHGSVSLKIEVE
ncbi:MAG: hypothetical protein J6M53_00175 [Bacteroidaceae bacterium]|nr:hypothetical protein [Bacteroidaceae bacterium]